MNIDKILNLSEYLHEMRPDLLEIVKPEYQNYLNWISPSTFLQFGRLYKINKRYKGEVWLLDDYDITLYDGHNKLHNPGIVLHFTKIEYDKDWYCEDYTDIWQTPQECYWDMMEDVTKKVRDVKLGTHKYKVKWFWHPEHFKKDSNSWRDVIGIEYHYKKSKAAWYNKDVINEYACNIYYINGQYDEETDEVTFPSEWNNLRLGADNTCWCVDIGSGRSGFSHGRFEGRFKLREAKQQYLGLKSLNELTPMFTELPPFTDENLKVDLKNLKR